MKTRLKIYILLFFTMFYQFAFAEASETLDSIVAVVNDEVVTQSELNHSLRIAKAQLQQANVSQPEHQVLQKQVLDQLVNKKLQLQIAKQIGINITEMDINHAVEKVASRNNISIEDLYQRLNQDGVSASEYRNQIREEMTVQKLQQQEIAGHISVTANEIKTFINSKNWKNKISQNNASNAVQEYKLEDVLIPLAENASAADIKSANDKAKQMMAQLNNGKTFAVIAHNEKNQKPLLDYVDLGWRKPSEIPSLFIKKIINMKANDVAGPIQAGNGLHIIHLVATRNAGAKDDYATLDKNQARQLLLQRKFETNVDTWLSRIRGQAFISML